MRLDWQRAAVRRFVSELARVELIDRSLALGAQMLLAIIPLLMVVGAFLPQDWGSDLLAQVRDTIGVRDDVMEPLREAAINDPATQPEVGLLSLLVALASATSFSRAMQRMYARAWDLPTYKGLRAVRGSVVWLLGWVAMLQITALLLRSVTGVPLTGPFRIAVQLVANTLLWWWSARLLLGGRVSWRDLLPGALLTGLLVVALGQLSSLFMPRFALANLDQFGPLGVVFAIASWLVLFGGVLVVATVMGRQLSPTVSAGRSSSGDDEPHSPCDQTRE
jgi:membrane protein